MEKDDYIPLFETKRWKGTNIYRVFAGSIFVGIVLVWVYRAINIPSEYGTRFVWVGMFAAEVWFGLYWVLTQSARWNKIYRLTFRDRLSHKFEKELPCVDVFVCTADPTIEPPIMVINTVLSVMTYDYPPEKLSVYLSDDGGSKITFYALWEASFFSKHWLPYCKKYNVEPRSPAAYFSSFPKQAASYQASEYYSIKKLYTDMENRIEIATRVGRIPQEAQVGHGGFLNWDSFVSKGDHETIIQILINGDNSDAKDVDGSSLPTLVYLAREKRPQHFHNFKAGAMNALIRVSSEISNAPIILNVDCDMYSNNSQAVRDALCFFMDERQGNRIAFVQFPQNYENVTKNDLYGNSLTTITQVDFYGIDGHGGPLYVGSGCFHRRETLCGRKYSKECRAELTKERTTRYTRNIQELEEGLKVLANCQFEENSKWGDEIGLKYGCPVEDVITGLSIQCRGWNSVYYNPERRAFLGVASTTLDQTLVQQKRWSEGDLQILVSKYSPVWYGVGRLKLGHIMGYCIYCLWSPNCLATIYYCIIPSLHLLKAIPLFPQISSLWFLPFAYVLVAEYIYSLVEFLYSGGTICGWWNDQRMWLYKRVTSYLFAFIDTIFKIVGLSTFTFVITDKTTDEDVTMRYNQEIMEFGVSSTMFTILASLAMLNLLCVIWMVKKIVADVGVGYAYEYMILQTLLGGILVAINFPLYNAMFLRKDKGRMPTSVTCKSFFLALSLCTCYAYLY